MKERKPTDSQYQYESDHVKDHLDEIGKGNVIASIWWLEDVQGRAYENNINLTDDECRDVLCYIKNNHDACIGINWDTIDYWIDVVVSERT